jgi:hypothetical protein
LLLRAGSDGGEEGGEGKEEGRVLRTFLNGFVPMSGRSNGIENTFFCSLIFNSGLFRRNFLTTRSYEKTDLICTKSRIGYISDLFFISSD